MLSFGIELALAFSIAFWSARFPAGSGPPSFAATMIARESFEKSLPRLASAAPFLCLIDDHLLCPDIYAPGPLRGFPHSLEEQLVHTCIFGELGMKRGDEKTALAQEDGGAVLLREHLDLRARVAHSGRADEHAPQRLLLARQREVGLEARD